MNRNELKYLPENLKLDIFELLEENERLKEQNERLEERLRYLEPTIREHNLAFAKEINEAVDDCTLMWKHELELCEASHRAIVDQTTKTWKHELDTRESEWNAAYARLDKAWSIRLERFL